MPHLKILVWFTTTLLLMHSFKSTTAIPSDSATNRNLTADYLALHAVLGKNLVGTEQEKTKVVDLLLQLLEEIDLPTLCEVVINDTKRSNKIVSQVPIKSTNIDADLLNELRSQILSEGQGIELTPKPFKTMNLLSQKTKYDESDIKLLIPTSDDQKNINIQDADMENHQVPATFKYHTNELWNAGSNHHGNGRLHIDNDVRYPDEFIKFRNVDSNKEEFSSNKYGVPVTPGLLKQEIVDLAQSPIKSQPTELRSIYNRFTGDDDTNKASVDTKNIKQESMLVRNINAERPKAEVFSQSLVLSDWMNNKNRFNRNLETSFLKKMANQNKEDYFENYIESTSYPATVRQNRIRKNMKNERSDNWPGVGKSEGLISLNTKNHGKKQREEKYLAKGSHGVVDQISQAPRTTSIQEKGTIPKMLAAISSNQHEVDYMKELRSTFKANKQMPDLPTRTTVNKNRRTEAVYPDVTAETMATGYQQAVNGGTLNKAITYRQGKLTRPLKYDHVKDLVNRKDLIKIAHSSSTPGTISWIYNTDSTLGNNRPTLESTGKQRRERVTMAVNNPTVNEDSTTEGSYLDTESHLTTDTKVFYISHKVYPTSLAEPTHDSSVRQEPDHFGVKGYYTRFNDNYEEPQVTVRVPQHTINGLNSRYISIPDYHESSTFVNPTTGHDKLARKRSQTTHDVDQSIPVRKIMEQTIYSGSLPLTYALQDHNNIRHEPDVQTTTLYSERSPINFSTATSSPHVEANMKAASPSATSISIVQDIPHLYKADRMRTEQASTQTDNHVIRNNPENTIILQNIVADVTTDAIIAQQNNSNTKIPNTKSLFSTKTTNEITATVDQQDTSDTSMPNTKYLFVTETTNDVTTAIADQHDTSDTSMPNTKSLFFTKITNDVITAIADQHDTSDTSMPNTKSPFSTKTTNDVIHAIADQQDISDTSMGNTKYLFSTGTRNDVTTDASIAPRNISDTMMPNTEYISSTQITSDATDLHSTTTNIDHFTNIKNTTTSHTFDHESSVNNSGDLQDNKHRLENTSSRNSGQFSSNQELNLYNTPQKYQLETADLSRDMQKQSKPIAIPTKTAMNMPYLYDDKYYQYTAGPALSSESISHHTYTNRLNIGDRNTKDEDVNMKISDNFLKFTTPESYQVHFDDSTTARSVSTTARSVSTTARSVSTTARSVNTTARSVSTTARSVTEDFIDEQNRFIKPTKALQQSTDLNHLNTPVSVVSEDSMLDNRTPTVMTVFDQKLTEISTAVSISNLDITMSKQLDARKIVSQVKVGSAEMSKEAGGIVNTTSEDSIIVGTRSDVATLLRKLSQGDITAGSLKKIASRIAQTKANISEVNANLLKQAAFRAQYERKTENRPANNTTTVSVMEDKTVSDNAQLPTIASAVNDQRTSFTISLDQLNGDFFPNNDDSKTSISFKSGTQQKKQFTTDFSPRVSTVANSNDKIASTTEHSTNVGKATTLSVTVPSVKNNNAYTLSVIDSSDKFKSEQLNNLKDQTQNTFNDFSGTIEANKAITSDKRTIHTNKISGKAVFNNVVVRPTTWNSDYDFSQYAHENYRNKHNPRVDISSFSDLKNEINFPSKKVPLMDPWKAYNIALGKSKVKQYNKERNENIQSPEIHIYSDYKYAGVPSSDSMTRNNLWKARPWPAVTENNKQTKNNMLYNNMVSEKSGLFQNKNIDLGDSMNYQTKKLNKIDFLTDQIKNNKKVNMWGNRFSQGYYGRVLEDENSFKKSSGSNAWLPFHSHDMVNFDILDPHQQDLKGYTTKQILKNKHNLSNQHRQLKPTDTLVNLNSYPRYGDLNPKLPLYTSGQIDQDSKKVEKTDFSNSRKDKFDQMINNFGNRGTIPKMNDTISALTTDNMNQWINDLEPTSQGVPAYDDYKCPGLFGYHKDPHNCQAFFICSWGMAHRVVCPQGTLYNSKEAVCDWAVNVRCSVSQDNAVSHSL